LASTRDRYTLRAVRAVFNDEKKLSIAALSQTLPERLIEQTPPRSQSTSGTAHWRIGYRYRNDAVPRQVSVQILSRSTSTPNCFLKQNLMEELKPPSHVVLTVFR